MNSHTSPTSRPTPRSASTSSFSFSSSSMCHSERSEEPAFSSGVKHGGEARLASRTASPPVIPNEAGRFSLPLSLPRKRRPADVRTAAPSRAFCAMNLSSDSTGGSVGSLSGGSAAAGVVAFGGAFAGALGFAHPEHAFAGVVCCTPGFPTVKYLRIFSRRLGPRPRIASKSSTLLNAPYDLRICKILSAVAGPIPGTNCNCSEFAVLMLTGCAGGFFFPAKAAGENSRPLKRIGRNNRAQRSRDVITGE